jgi:hypothetical protein
MGKLFLSHKSVNKNLVGWLKEQLRRHGHEPWYDADNILAGDLLERAIQDGIKTSEGAVFFITAAYKDDKWIASEINYAVAETRNRSDFKLIPIIYKERKKDPNPLIPQLLEPFTAKTVYRKEEALLEILRRLGDERARLLVQSEIPPTPPRWTRLKRLFSRPALSHALALLIGVALTAGVMFATARKRNDPEIPVIPVAAPRDDAAIEKEQRDKALMAFAEDLDPKLLVTTFSLNKSETGKWVDICKVDIPPKGRFYMAVVEVTRDVRTVDGKIEKDRKDKCFIILSLYPLDFKAFGANAGEVLVEPQAVVYGSLASEVGKTIHLRVEMNKQNNLERHLFLRVIDIPAPSYEVVVRLYSIQSSLLTWFF